MVPPNPREEVLDKGYVELIDHMGTEDAVVDAARVSFGKEASAYTDLQNAGLLRYLIEHHHETPFEMVVYKFRVKAPVAVWWHWTRHRLASYNFISGRYVPFDETEVYHPTEWRKQSKDNKQGSDGVVDEHVQFLSVGYHFGEAIAEEYAQYFDLYQDMLDTGVARKQARLALPFYACYYEAIVLMNARSLGNFLNLRRGQDAQSEIRDYADALFKIVSSTHPKLFPA